MKFLIAGASGQLAKAFIARFKRCGVTYAAPSESMFDITDATAVDTVLNRTTPDVLVNCAAYNNVDGAEIDPLPAFRVNTAAVGTLAAAVRRRGITMVHYGSDYVFDGMTDRPYVEDDPASPLNAYGRSKLAGEISLQHSGADYLLLRLSWVYGNGSQNFFHKLLQWIERGTVLKVVRDEISVPTYAEDIVTYTLTALDAGLRGRYHLTNTGYASRYEVARHFFNCMGRDVTLLPTGSDAFQSPAIRPSFSAMSNARISSCLDISIPAWEDAVERFATRLLPA